MVTVSVCDVYGVITEVRTEVYYTESNRVMGDALGLKHERR